MNARIELALGNLEKAIQESIKTASVLDMTLVEFRELRDSIRFAVSMEEALQAKV